MRARLTIAALTGVAVGLSILTWFQAGELREARLLLEAASEAPPPIQVSTNSRPLRLRLHSLPPITIRSEVRTLDWSALESEDYATYIQNLRSVGCPEVTIRDIIVADVEKLFAARRRAMAEPQSDWEYWRHPHEIPEDDAQARSEREHEARVAALEREKRRLLHELLGDAAVRASLEEYAADAGVDRNLRFLPPEKRQAIAEANALWMLAQESAALLSEVDRGEAEKRTITAARELKEAIGKILTPEEQLEYELRGSARADELRGRLRGFGASRDEFQQLFELERQFENEHSRMMEAVKTGTDPQAKEKLEALGMEHEERIEKALGPERYAEYERVRDPDYQTLFSLAKDHSVPTELANQVWSMRHEVENQTARVRQNPFLTAEQKVRALGAIRAETQSAIVDVLGEPLLDDYQRQGGGWLVDLTEPIDLGETGRELVPPPLPGEDSGRAEFVPVLPTP